jgi:hypothetical protein
MTGSYVCTVGTKSSVIFYNKTSEKAKNEKEKERETYGMQRFW